MPTLVAIPCPTGCHLYAGRVSVLGVPGRRGPPLTEVADVLLRHVVATQVQERVEEHRRVSTRKHEPVAVEPLGVARVVFEMPLKEDVADGRERHGCSGVTGVGCLHRIHGEDADGVDGEALQVVHPTTKLTRRSFT
jgi:hypothetical protein